MLICYKHLITALSVLTEEEMPFDSDPELEEASERIIERLEQAINDGVIRRNHPVINYR